MFRFIVVSVQESKNKRCYNDKKCCFFAICAKVLICFVLISSHFNSRNIPWGALQLQWCSVKSHLNQEFKGNTVYSCGVSFSSLPSCSSTTFPSPAWMHLLSSPMNPRLLVCDPWVTLLREITFPPVPSLQHTTKWTFHSQSKQQEVGEMPFFGLEIKNRLPEPTG